MMSTKTSDSDRESVVVGFIFGFALAASLFYWAGTRQHDVILDALVGVSTMNHQQTLQKAWTKWQQKQEYGTAAYPEPSEEFDYAFMAAWDALIAEIRPLVADLRTLAEFDRGDLRPSMEDEIRAHFKAVNRLRALVREGE